MRAYYNEFDPFAAAWLRELIADGLIAPGDVDDRSIADVSPADLVGYTQCHFFAGIGGWSYALRLAGWPDDRPVWTGSCPCQPFSAAGKGEGGADPRHLWPEWFRLVRECRPVAVFGEQVEAAIGHGWLDLVSADLEGEGYAVGAVVLGAHSVGAPHRRQRLWFVADRTSGGRGILGDAAQPGRGGHADGGIKSRELADAQGPRGWAGLRQGDPLEHRDGSGGGGGLGDAEQPGSQGLAWHERDGDEPGRLGAEPAGSTAATGAWAGALWLPCRDGKARPTQPGLFPLAHGVPNRVGTLRGAGNAIVPQVAAEFVRAYMESAPSWGAGRAA